MSSVLFRVLGLLSIPVLRWFSLELVLIASVLSVFEKLVSFLKHSYEAELQECNVRLDSLQLLQPDFVVVEERFVIVSVDFDVVRFWHCLSPPLTMSFAREGPEDLSCFVSFLPAILLQAVRRAGAWFALEMRDWDSVSAFHFASLFVSRAVVF